MHMSRLTPAEFEEFRKEAEEAAQLAAQHWDDFLAADKRWKEDRTVESAQKVKAILEKMAPWTAKKDQENV